MALIYIVEDDESIREIETIALKNSGHMVGAFGSSKEFFKKLDEILPDLVLLDVMLPDESGYDIIKKIREDNNDVPVIFTSARDKDLDKIIGLELGSDDYITKPYSPKELVLRVNNIIRRVYTKERQKITYKDYIIDLDKRMAFQGDEDLNLTTLEFDLLYMFVTNKEKSFSRDDILNNIWGENYFGTDRVVDDLIRRLRKKMPLLDINTIYGYGYRLL